MSLRINRVHIITQMISFLIMLSGCAVLDGWFFNVQALKSVYPGLIVMTANTAICFILTGLAMLYFQIKPLVEFNNRLVIALCISFILLISLATLCEYIYHWDFHIDQLFFKEHRGDWHTLFAGRMTFHTAYNFFLIGIILTLLTLKERKFIYGVQWLALVVGYISLLYFIGYIYGVKEFLGGDSVFSGMALHTSVLFVLVVIGILFLRPAEGSMAEVTCKSSGGKILRRFLPIAILTPICLGFLKLYTQRHHIYSNEFGVTLVAMGDLSIVSFYIYFLAVIINRSDIKRKELEISTSQAKDSLEKQSRELKSALKEAVKSRMIVVSMLDDNNKIRENLEGNLKELKLSQNMLIHSEKLASLGRLVSEITHEINNPLMIISGYAQLVLMSDSISKEDKDYLKIIVQECQRTKEVTRRILKFSRLSRGDIKEVDISQCIDAVVSIIERQFALNHNIEIKRYYPENAIFVCLDEQQMHEVFMNLLDNAKESMPQGGVITIGISLQDERVKIEFRDTGIGMSEEVLRKIIEPYFTTKESGTGIGLGVCYGIIKAHNGDLTFESELGKGTVATVLLPLNAGGRNG